MSQLGKRFRECREQRKMSQRDVEKATRISQAAISLIESGKRELVSSDLVTLAQFYGIELLNPLGSNVGPVTLQGSLVPVWSQSSAARIFALTHSDQERETMQHIMSAKKYSAQAFAMQLEDDSMLPRFRKGDLVIVDPDVKESVGKFVVARINDLPAGMLGQYADRGSDQDGQIVFELIPLNTFYTSKRSDNQREALKVLGVVVEKIETDF